MSVLESLSCPNCGAALSVQAPTRTILACGYCGTSFRTFHSLTPEPEMGDLLLGADFRDGRVPGWKLSNSDKLTFKPGPPPELWAAFPESDRIHPVVITPGPLEDVDVSVNLRFIEGDQCCISAGLELRRSDAGDYVILVSAQGTYQVGVHTETTWTQTLVDWTEHPSLHKEMGASNRLRVITCGQQIRVYLNGVVATSLRDTRYASGLVRLVVAPGSKSPVVVAFSDLQLREVP